jgi:hypothetical protein
MGILLGALVVASACGYAGDPVVDGIRIGPAVPCPECDQPNPDVGSCHSCESVADVARDLLDVRWPFRPASVTLTFHNEGCPATLTERCQVARSGKLIVALAAYADGAEHAVAVYCGVGGCIGRPDYRSEGNGVSP